MKTVRISGGRQVSVIFDTDQNSVVSHRDMEMDKRAQQAVKAAVEKAEVCRKPIAKYDRTAKKAYIQYADGTKKYVE